MGGDEATLLFEILRTFEATDGSRLFKGKLEEEAEEKEAEEAAEADSDDMAIRGRFAALGCAESEDAISRPDEEGDCCCNCWCAIGKTAGPDP